MSGEPGSVERYEIQRLREAQEADKLAARNIDRMFDEKAQGKHDPNAAKCAPEPTSEKDPWKHRSAGMTCATCMWYVEKAVPPLTKVGYQRIGRCRRHAPSMNGYPVVYPADWCGDHKLDEMKL